MSQTLYEVGLNGQVVKLERMLNDAFDSDLRRIYITDGERYETANFYSFYLDKSFEFYSHDNEEVVSLYSYGLQGEEVTYDFIVHVPVSLVYDSILMNAMIKKYKILGRTYTIETF